MNIQNYKHSFIVKYLFLIIKEMYGKYFAKIQLFLIIQTKNSLSTFIFIFSIIFQIFIIFDKNLSKPKTKKKLFPEVSHTLK